MKHSIDNAGKRSQEVWGTNPAGWTHAFGKKLGTKEYFEEVLKGRFKNEHYWLAEFVDYSLWKHKKVLEVGCGAGYDAYMFCKNKADYTGIDITPENIDRTKKHLELYGLSGTIVPMDATALTFQEKFDLVYSFGVLHHIPRIDRALNNIASVMADDGHFYCVLYYKHSFVYWVRWYIPWILKGIFLKQSFEDYFARIEYTESDKKPHVDVYSKNVIKKMWKDAGFGDVTITINQLRKEDLPQWLGLRFVWAKVPESTIVRLGKWIGWYICIKAKKSASLS